jgi:hypothetical protein
MIIIIGGGGADISSEPFSKEIYDAETTTFSIGANVIRSV